MTVYYGKWEMQAPQTTAQGRVRLNALGQPLQTRYLKSVKPADLRIMRDRMAEISGQIQRWGREMGWADTEALLGVSHPLPTIGNDPRTYTLEQMTRDILTHLSNRRPGGRPHDLTRSFIDRHNWLVGAWVRALLEWDPEQDPTAFEPWLIEIRDADTEQDWREQELKSLFS